MLQSCFRAVGMMVAGVAGQCAPSVVPSQPPAKWREPPQTDRASARLDSTAYGLMRGRLPRSSSTRHAVSRPTLPDNLPTLREYSCARSMRGLHDRRAGPPSPHGLRGIPVVVGSTPFSMAS